MHRTRTAYGRYGWWCCIELLASHCARGVMRQKRLYFLSQVRTIAAMATKKLPSQQSNFELHNIEDIIALEKRDRLSMNAADKIASTITAFSGSMLYVGLHVVWFGIWVAWNTGALHLHPFDRFPFNLLTMLVSLEAIFLSSFVLISQNKQALQAD